MYVVINHIVMKLMCGEPEVTFVMMSFLLELSWVGLLCRENSIKISIYKCIKILKLTFQNVQEEIKDIN
jgi:hypothetical protein